MGKNLLQNRILEHIGYVEFSEEMTDQTLINLSKDPKMQKETEYFASLYLTEQIFDPEFIIMAREEKCVSVCFLVQNLLHHYTMDAIECLIFYQYLRALSVDLEKNLSWYETNTKNVFKVVPSSQLKEAEAALWKYLHNIAPRDQSKNRYRHLLTISFLFFDYLSYPEDLAILLDQIEQARINLNSLDSESKCVKKITESAG